MTEPRLDVLTPGLDSFRPRAVTIDADGVLHRGRTVLPGAADLLARLDAAGIPWKIVTNNSRQTPAVSAQHYRHLGLSVDAENVLTAGNAMATYIATHHSGEGKPLVFSMGDADLSHTLELAGCEIVDDEDVCEWVAVGLDRQLTYDRLRRACDAIRRGARFVTANMDPSIPSETGAIPGVGAIATAIAVATGIEPTNVGKPAPELMLQAIDAMGATPATSVHLGDRLDSDVMGARRAGMVSVLVTTGGHSRADALARPTTEQPDAIAVDIAAVLEWMGLG